MATSSDPKIILIGLNRCGTTSLHRLFEGSGIPSLHWRDRNDRNLAQTMMANIALGMAPLAGFGDTRAFSDLSFVSRDVVIEGARFFPMLHRAYPDAYFILNTRPKDNWLASRKRHAGGSYMARYMAATKVPAEACEAEWSTQFDTHHADARAYFRGNPNFIEFDIERDAPQCLADLLTPDFTISPELWGQHNAGGPKRAATA